MRRLQQDPLHFTHATPHAPAPAAAASPRSGGLQTAHAASIGIGVVPAANQAAVFENFVNDIMVKQGGHWNAGISGTFYFHRALIAGGRGDVALHTLLDDSYPSFGYWWNNAYEPATTFWEVGRGGGREGGRGGRERRGTMCLTPVPVRPPAAPRRRLGGPGHELAQPP